jgi:hypothetical protein
VGDFALRGARMNRMNESAAEDRVELERGQRCISRRED